MVEMWVKYGNWEYLSILRTKMQKFEIKILCTVYLVLKTNVCKDRFHFLAIKAILSGLTGYTYM